MKKIKLLVVALLLFAFSIPVFANAEEAVTRSEAKVYIFKGETCGFCAKALEFFKSIEEEYGKYFELVEYEVWNNAANAELMNKVAEHLGIEISGVPFIIIGEKTYPGFDAAWAEDIKKDIMTEYNKEESDRVDVIKEAQKVVNYDTLITVISIISLVGIIAFVYFARKDVNADEKENVKKTKKVLVKDDKDEEEVAVKVTEKKTETKKVNSNKKEKTTTSNTKKKTTSTSKKKKN